jgi:hypothetical protein
VLAAAVLGVRARRRRELDWARRRLAQALRGTREKPRRCHAGEQPARGTVQNVIDHRLLP